MATVAVCSANIFDHLPPLDPTLEGWLDEPQLKSDLLAGVTSAVASMTNTTVTPLEVVVIPNTPKDATDLLLRSQQLLIENHGLVEATLHNENRRLKQELDARDQVIATLRSQLRAATESRDQAARDLSDATADLTVHKSEFVRMRTELGELHSQLQRAQNESASAQVYAQQVRQESLTLRRSMASSSQASSQQIQLLLDRNARLKRELMRLRSTLNLDLDREIREYTHRRVDFDAPPFKRHAIGLIPTINSAPGPIHQ